MRRPLFSRPLSLLSGLFDTNRCFDFSSAHDKPRKLHPALPATIFEETTAGEAPVKATNVHTMDGSRSPPQAAGSKLRSSTDGSSPKVIEAPIPAKPTGTRPPIQATAMAAGVWTHVTFRQAETVPNPVTTSTTRVSSGTGPASRSSAARGSTPPNLPLWAQAPSSLHQGPMKRATKAPSKATRTREASPEANSNWVPPVQSFHGWKPNTSYRTYDPAPQVVKRTAPHYQTRTVGLTSGSNSYLPFDFPERTESLQTFTGSLPTHCFVSGAYSGAARAPQYPIGLPTRLASPCFPEQAGCETREYETVRKTSRCGLPTRIRASSPLPSNYPTHGLRRVAAPVEPARVASPVGATLYRSRSSHMGGPPVEAARVASPAGATLYRSRSSHMGSPARSSGVVRYTDGSREVPKPVRVIRAPPPNVVRLPLNEESASREAEDPKVPSSPSRRTPKRGRLMWFPEGYTDSGSSGAPYTPKRAVKSCV